MVFRSLKLIPGEFSSFTVAIAVLSGFIVFFGYISMFLKEKMFLSEAFVALVVGIISGPLVTNAISPNTWEGSDEITKQLTRCIIAVQVMAVGIELPKHYMKKEWLTMLMLLFPVMMFMWLISGLIIWALIPPITYLESLVISACICPTDPILANSVVKGRFAEKHVPSHVRNALSAESGGNDGLGFPFLFLAIFLLNEDTVGTAIGKWIYITLLFQILLSCIIGAVVGWLACKLLQWSKKNHLIDKPSFLSFAIALALFLMSMTGFTGSDDVLACFVAGNAFSWDEWFRKETEEAHFQDVIDMMLNLAVFVYIGAIIPWSEFENAVIGLSPWRLVVIAILVLLFRRLPIVIALKPFMPAIKTYREAIFAGFFGPIGCGSVFLCMIAKDELKEVYSGQATPAVLELITPVVLFIVMSSTLVHGTTIPLFKIGNRIRTRTLSITSIGSGASQVLHLPKFQQRRSEDDLLHHYHHPKSAETAMTELQRNTLFNTIQRDHTLPTIKPSSTTTIVIGDEPHHIYPNSSSITQINHEHDKGNGMDDDYLLDTSKSTASVSLSSSHINVNGNGISQSSLGIGTPALLGTENSRRGSTATLEAQGIRFLEPVKPRMSSQTNLNTMMDRNESSVSSFKSWISKHTKDGHHHGKRDQSETSSTHSGTVTGSPQMATATITTITAATKREADETTKQKHHHHSGLRHLFRSNKEATNPTPGNQHELECDATNIVNEKDVDDRLTTVDNHKNAMITNNFNDGDTFRSSILAAMMTSDNQNLSNIKLSMEQEQDHVTTKKEGLGSLEK
ncbi:unnamed protein product [Absidia cylindrospora]